MCWWTCVCVCVCVCACARGQKKKNFARCAGLFPKLMHGLWPLLPWDWACDQHFAALSYLLIAGESPIWELCTTSAYTFSQFSSNISAGTWGETNGSDISSNNVWAKSIGGTCWGPNLSRVCQENGHDRRAGTACQGSVFISVSILTCLFSCCHFSCENGLFWSECLISNAVFVIGWIFKCCLARSAPTPSSSFLFLLCLLWWFVSYLATKFLKGPVKAPYLIFTWCCNQSLFVTVQTSGRLISLSCITFELLVTEACASKWLTIQSLYTAWSLVN